jgi:hypothetical protein
MGGRGTPCDFSLLYLKEFPMDSIGGIKHSFWQGPWHYCDRCDVKTHLSEMTWQRGKLLCNARCVDRKLVGDREIAIAEVLSDGKTEYAPVEKIQNPNFMQDAEDFII